MAAFVLLVLILLTEVRPLIRICAPELRGFFLPRTPQNIWLRHAENV